MAARSIWNGTLTFGAVAIPVKLFSAVETRSLAFKEVRREDGAAIAHQRIGAETGDEIPFKEIEKGFDTGDGMLILSKEEVAAADGARAKVIELERFVDAGEIDPVFYDKPYHLGAGVGGGRAYRVLLAALERTGKVGIGHFVLRSREQLVAVRPIHGALGMQTMRFYDELLGPGDLDLPDFGKAPAKKELEMAGKLVEMLEGEWEPAAHQDTYREAVMALIEAKAAGEPAPEAPEPAAPKEVDLLAALEASIAAGSGHAKRRRTATKKPSGPTDKPKGPPKAKDAPTTKPRAKRASTAAGKSKSKDA